jgi:hypothetical protein
MQRYTQTVTGVNWSAEEGSLPYISASAIPKPIIEHATAVMTPPREPSSSPAINTMTRNPDAAGALMPPDVSALCVISAVSAPTSTQPARRVLPRLLIAIETIVRPKSSTIDTARRPIVDGCWRVRSSRKTVPSTAVDHATTCSVRARSVRSSVSRTGGPSQRRRRPVAFSGFDMANRSAAA